MSMQNFALAIGIVCDILGAIFTYFTMKNSEKE